MARLNEPFGMADTGFRIHDDTLPRPEELTPFQEACCLELENRCLHLHGREGQEETLLFSRGACRTASGWEPYLCHKVEEDVYSVIRQTLSGGFRAMSVSLRHRTVCEVRWKRGPEGFQCRHSLYALEGGALPEAEALGESGFFLRLGPADQYVHPSGGSKATVDAYRLGGGFSSLCLSYGAHAPTLFVTLDTLNMRGAGMLFTPEAETPVSVYGGFWDPNRPGPAQQAGG